MNKIFSLDGKWEFKEAGTDKTMPVTIPGSVMSGLLENKVIEHPYYRCNEYEARELCRKDYVFSKSFNIDVKKDMCHELVLEGIDTVAEVYINGKKLIETCNMHRRYLVNIDGVLEDGNNSIEVYIKSPIEYVENHVAEPGKEIHFTNTGTMTGSQYLRKAHSMFGWDWGIQLPDMGIWRSIYINEYEDAQIDYLRIEQIHNATQTKVSLKVSADIHHTDLAEEKTGNSVYITKVTVEDPKGNVIVSEVDAKDDITIDNPELWWPNGIGEQPLYKVTVALYSGLHKLSEKSEFIGLRTLTVSQDKDQWGSEFCFKINGIKIFSKGADYIPEDAIYSNITENVYKHLIDSSVECGFNTLRIWGGGYYPSNEFYEMCDRAGLILWQDFMYACNVYELFDEFKVNITRETLETVRRLRNHACLGLMCGNNEVESAFVNWGGFKDHSDALKQDYLEIFENIIPGIVKSEAPAVFYWPSSPSTTGGFNAPDDDNHGDRHYWDVWHGEKPFTDYEKYFFRFCSEFGFQSFPEMATIRSFTKPGDLNIFTPVMESHQKNGTANAKILNYIADNFLYPKDFESLVYVSQVLQGMAMKYGVDHFRRNRGRCMGALYWQLNDNWPVASWASIDYYGRWKATQYMARDFFANVSGSLKREGNCFVPYVQNETKEAVTSEVTVWVKDVDNKILCESTYSLCTDAFSVSHGETVDITNIVAGREATSYVEALLKHSDGTKTQLVEPVLKYKAMDIPECKVNITTKILDKETVEATVKADKFAAFVALFCEEVNIIWDKNYFFITDSNEIKIRGRIVGNCEGAPSVKAISLCDSYER